MIVSRMHILTLLSIYILIGSMAYNANGVSDCYRPNFTNPYAIVLDPDQQIYAYYYPITFECIDGHTIFGLPDTTYCGSTIPTFWDPDPSEGLCEAQCNTINLLDNDIMVMVNDSQQTLVDSRTTATFSCRDPGQSTGPASSICTNGTFDYSDEPSCLAYCPVNLDELGVGLYYDIADDPVINETSTLYYRDGDEITYRCSDGYESPRNRTPTDDGTSTCNDGSWDPPEIPTCMGMMTTMELPTSKETTTIADQSTIALTTTKASTTEGLPTSLPNSTPPLTTPMTPTDSSTTSVVTPGLTITPDAMTLTPDSTTVGSGLTTVTPDATSLTPGLTTVGSGLTTVTPDATSITPGLTTVTPDAMTVTPDSTTVGSGLTTITPDATTTTFDSTTVGSGLTTVTPDATTTTLDSTTVGSGLTTITPDATTTTLDSTTVGSGLTTITPDATTATSDATSITPGLTTVATDSSTVIPVISTETATPTVPESTTKSDSTTSSNPTSLLPETTETVSVRSTSPGDPTEPSTTESQETTASQKTSPRTPERTEKPPTTPLPCIECRATQVCNAENNCECRPDYYEDEGDPENPCKEPESIDVTIKITEVNESSAEYNVKLGNSSSPEFKKLESDVCKPFEEIYKNDTEYKGCRVLEFRNGSIIVNYVLTFAENSTQSASTVNATVQEELQNPNGSFSGDYEFDDSSLVVAPLDQCEKELDDCDSENAICTNQGADGYTCECREGFDDVGGSNLLPGRKCTESVATETQPTVPRTTEEPKETGLEPWKVVVGVTVPIISILTITIVGLTCWQYRRLHRTSPKSAPTKMRTFPYDDDTRGSSDRRASRPESMMIMNNDGTVQEVVLPWRNIPAEEEFIFAPDNGKGRTQMLPMVDYPSDYDGSASYGNDPLGNIVGSYDNYNYQHHDMTNSTEIDSKYF